MKAKSFNGFKHYKQDLDNLDLNDIANQLYRVMTPSNIWKFLITIKLLAIFALFVLFRFAIMA